MNRPPVDLSVELPTELAAVAARFEEALRRTPVRAAAVAFSGGVDSSVAAALTARALGAERVTAVLGVSPSLAGSERDRAHRTAEEIGVPVVEVATYEMDVAGYRANEGNRCYFCKTELYSRAFSEALTGTGADVLVNGETADDLVRDDRPGRRAALELGVRSPLAEAGIGKAQIREMAQALGLSVWDKPSSPCLASRVPVRTPVTVEVLGRVERAEEVLKRAGVRDLRVRHHGRTAKVEMSRQGHRVLADRAVRDRVLAEIRAVGYGEVQLVPSPLERE